MKITLRKVLLCGIALLACLFIMLAFVAPIKVTWDHFTSEGEFVAMSTSGSLWENISSTPFHQTFVDNGLILSLSGNSSAPEKYAQVADTTVKVCAIIGLVFFILALLATIGAFFIKAMKGARVLTIIFIALAIVVCFTVSSISLGGLNLSTSGHRTETSGTPIFMLLAALACFIAMIVVSLVVKDKVLVGPKDEEPKKEEKKAE